jgi:hypothetical protein
LGLRIGGSEGTHFGMMIFDELKTRGVEQMLFLCMDGLKDLGRGVMSIFPQPRVQRCMVHLQCKGVFMPKGESPCHGDRNLITPLQTTFLLFG